MLFFLCSLDDHDDDSYKLPTSDLNRQAASVLAFFRFIAHQRNSLPWIKDGQQHQPQWVIESVPSTCIPFFIILNSGQNTM